MSKLNPEKRDLSQGDYGCWISATLDLWPIIEALNFKHKNNVGVSRKWSDNLDRIHVQIERMKWAQVVCFDHQAWARFDFETGKPNVAARRILETQEKLKRLADRIRSQKP